MSQVNIKLDMWGEAKDVPVRMEIFDLQLKLVKERWADGISSSAIELETGTYNIRVTLPSGRIVNKSILVLDEEPLDVTIPLHQVSPNEHHEWAYVTKGIEKAGKKKLDEDVFEGVWARMWARNLDSDWRVEPLDTPNQLVTNDDGATFKLNYFDQEQYFLQVGGEHVPWKLVSIAPKTDVMVLIRPASGSEDRTHPLDVVVSSSDWELESLLSMIRRGKTEHATELLKEKQLAKVAEKKLQGKMADPYGAVIGGYALLHLNALDQMHDWANNLANLFPWIADGPIIHGWQLLEMAKDDTDASAKKEKIEKARLRFLEAEKRGIPLVAEGLTRLRNALLIYHRNNKNDSDVHEALQRIGRYTAVSDPTINTTVFEGKSPAEPSQEPTLGLPDDDLPISFVYDIPISAAIEMGLLDVGTDFSEVKTPADIPVRVNESMQLEFADGSTFKNLGALQRETEVRSRGARGVSDPNQPKSNVQEIETALESLRFRSVPARRRKKKSNVEKKMFKVKFLPATIGDCIWIEYGTESDPHFMLIDGGTAGTRKHIKKLLKAIPADKRKLELVVVSHVDKDHINGIRTLLEKQEVEFKIGDFWYNGFHHLPVPAGEELGAKQGEALSAALVDQKITWNKEFDGKSVVIPDSGSLPQTTLPGGMKLTLLGPTNDALAELRHDWIKEVEKAGMEPGTAVPDEDDQPSGDESLGVADVLTAEDIADLAESPFPGDGSSANGSSIAFLAEFDGKRVLFAADAHADQLCEALKRMSPSNRVKVDLFKVSHHGSKGTTNRELVEKVDTERYVFSTNGSIFKHPDDETIAKILTFGNSNLELSFNYRKKTNTVWEDSSLQSELNFTTIYPEDGKEGIELVI